MSCWLAANDNRLLSFHTAQHTRVDNSPQCANRSVEGGQKKTPEARAGKSRLGQSRTSLHAKMFVLDRRYSFIGSLNLDPRSIDINREELLEQLLAPDPAQRLGSVGAVQEAVSAARAALA